MVLRFPSAGYLGQFSLVCCLSLACQASVFQSRLFGSDKVSYQRDIRPILSDHCFACHGPDEQERKAELRLDIDLRSEATSLLALDKPDSGKIWQRITSLDDDEVMPPPDFHKPLKDDQRRLIRKWIEQGADFQQHWSFLSPSKPAVPENGETNPIDAFINARLDQMKLIPNSVADKATLFRRVTLDLTGLPPTLEESRRFMDDTSTDAYEKWIDALMQRMTYGEHMARYWLDLARYADTHGLHLDNERSMWPYRDWVVQAFHQNLRFDEFTRWQLAGDLLKNPTREQLIASGFNRCNVSTSEGGSINDEWIYRYAVDRTSTMAEVWMGLTAGCAVCHDHKFDPLSTRDYYSMYAFFHSAADPAMDGNIVDTPPVLRLFSEADEQKMATLAKQIAAIEKERQNAASKVKYQDPAKADPPPRIQTIEKVLFDDAFPEGAKLEPKSSRNWLSEPASPVHSGKLALKQTYRELGQSAFKSGADAFTMPANSTIFAYCYLDPNNPPQAIMLQFYSDGWKHRAIWGDKAKIPSEEDAPEALDMGPLPNAGAWVRLEVNSTKIGIKVSTKLNGFALTQFGGTVTWDKLGTSNKVDTTKDVEWSYSAWQEANLGKAAAGIPSDVREIVRSKKLADWSEQDSKLVFDYWLINKYAGANDHLDKFKTRLKTLEKRQAGIEEKTPVTFVMAELPKPRESFVMVRGAYDKPGDKVARRVPSFLPPLPKREDNLDYDRLDLANWLVSGKHPLTARVTVNRFWQQFFGIGLVKSSGDFGSQGDLPSHPELLDWLAVQFVEDGWDVQRLVKRIVTSKAYRRSSLVREDLLSADPENRWLARGPRLRLDAEVLRDQALFVSGLLVDRVGGKGVNPYQPPNIWEPVGFGRSNTRFYKRGKNDDLYRRSLYTFLKRTAPPPFMSTFDAPNREQSCSFRERSNTPLQALQLMNDIQHIEAARNFAQRIIKNGGQETQDRIHWAWQTALGRQPSSDEISVVDETLKSHLARYQKDIAAAKELIQYGESKVDDSIDAQVLAAYTMIANLLLNLDEAICRN
jgi:Protein of unknown function (DUF1553)/Protein of unknown function (DUF1549)/Planctomycete cytochrome C